MSGIAGLVDATGAAVDRAVLGAMGTRLAARGPDGEGCWTGPGVGLGHRRLAVIDPGPGGAQPMGSDDGQIQIVTDGTIYNFIDLRAELLAAGRRFRSRSDAEVVLRGYEHWGDGVLDRLEGEYALAVWDGRRRRLLAARDPWGQKSFYFAALPRPQGPLLAFASGLKALAEAGLERTIDREALDIYLDGGHVPAPRTILRGARKLHAGERLIADGSGGTLRLERFRRESAPSQPGAWPPDLFRRAVEQRLVADVPVGALLATELDAVVVAQMAELVGADEVRTFDIAFDDGGEDARMFAARLGTRHHEERIDAAAVLRALPEATQALDEPLGDPSVLSAFLLCRFARGHVKVVLAGGDDAPAEIGALDRAADAVGLELRAPYRDRDIAPFRPYAFVPEDLSSPSALSEIPLSRLLRQELAPVLTDELAADKLKREGLFDLAEVRTLLDEHLSGRHDRHGPLWRLLVFERWLASLGS